MPVYNTDHYKKHKRPKGWGSLCPNEYEPRAQELLDSGVQVGEQIFNVDGDFAFRAQEHTEGRWHGHPIPWSRIPVEAVRMLIATGRLDSVRWRKALRKHLGSEFDN